MKRRVDDDRNPFHPEEEPRVPEPDELVLRKLSEVRLHVRQDSDGEPRRIPVEKKLAHDLELRAVRRGRRHRVEILELPLRPVGRRHHASQALALGLSAKVRSRHDGSARSGGNRCESKKGYSASNQSAAAGTDLSHGLKRSSSGKRQNGIGMQCYFRFDRSCEIA